MVTVRDLFRTLPPYDIAVPRQIHTANESSPWVRGVEYGKQKLNWKYDDATAPRLLYINRVARPYESTDVICIQKNHKLPMNFEINYDLMFEKVMRKKFEPLLDSMGYFWNTIVGGEQSLDKWC